MFFLVLNPGYQMYLATFTKRQYCERLKGSVLTKLLFKTRLILICIYSHMSSQYASNAAIYILSRIVILINIYYRTDTGKYYELDTALPRVRRTSGTLYPTSNISRVSVR